MDTSSNDEARALFRAAINVVTNLQIEFLARLSEANLIGRDQAVTMYEDLAISLKNTSVALGDPNLPGGTLAFVSEVLDQNAGRLNSIAKTLAKGSPP